MGFVVAEEGPDFAVIVEAPSENIAVALNAGPTEIISAGGGITSINSLTAAAQTLAVIDDTNVTLDVTSVTDTHTITAGWTGTLALARGGTGSGTQAGARSNLGAAASGANSDITSLSGLTTPLSIAQGGTSQITANAALNALLPTQTGQSGKILKTDGSNSSWQTDSAGSGTVTSVGVSGGDGIGVVGSPITTSGIITLSLGDITPDSVAAVGTVTGSNLSGTNTGDQTITLTSDVTGSGTGSFAATIALGAVTTTKIADDNVTLPKIADQADQTILGNNTGGASSPVALTAAETKTVLSLNNVENTALSTWAGSANITTLGTIVTGTWNGTDIPLSAGGTGATLADPGADRIMFWDDSAGQVDWLIPGTNLTITDKTLDAAGGGGVPGGADGQIQYNNGGAFGGMSLASWNDATEEITLGAFTGGGNAVTLLKSGASGYGLSIDSSAASGSGLIVQSGANVGINVAMTSGNALILSATGTNPLLTGTLTNATTNVATDVAAVLGHNSTGAVANNFGARIELQLETSTTENSNAGYIQWSWGNATHASRIGSISHWVSDSVSAKEVIRLGGSGGASIITLPNQTAGVICVTGSGTVASSGSTVSGRINYGNGSGGLTGSSQLHFDPTNTRFGVGTTGSPATTFHGVHTTATTNAIVNSILLTVECSGTAAAGLGNGFLYNLESTTAVQNAARTSAIWIDPTNATRTSAFTVETVNNAAALTEMFRVGPNYLQLGESVAASGAHSVAIGNRAVANKSGQVTQASGRFAADGDAQSSVMVVRAATTDATANVELFLDGATGTQRMTIAADTAWMFNALVIGIQQNAAGTHSVKLAGVIKRDNANNTTLVYVNATDANGAGTATAQADDANEALKIVVTGVAATNIRWVARVELAEVSYP